jgi:hypothetical protein
VVGSKWFDDKGRTGSHDRIMCRIDINGLVERERDVTARKRAVDRSGKVGQWRLSQASDQFLDPADADTGGSGVTRPIGIPEAQRCKSKISILLDYTISMR